MTSERMTYAVFALAAVAGLLLIAALLNISSLGGASHQTAVSLLGQMRRQQAEVTREVMRVASFRVVQYDDLVELNRELSNLEGRLATLEWFDEPYFIGLVKAYRDSNERRQRLQERVKTLAAMLRNAHYYLPGALQAVERRQDAARLMVLGDYLVRLQRFSLLPGLGERRTIKLGIGAFRADLNLDRPGDQAVAALLDQMDAVIRWSSQLEQAMTDYLAVPIDRALGQLETADQVRFSRESEHLRRFSLVLVVVEVGLFIGLGVAMRRLRIARQRGARAAKRLRDAIESLSEAFALFDGDGRLRMWNRHFKHDFEALGARLTKGLTFAELATFLVQQARFADGEEDPEAALQRVLTHFQQAEQPHVQAMSDGRYLLLTTSTTTDGGRALVGVDISEQKQVEAELRKLSQVVEQSPVSVMLTGRDGVIEYVNPMFERLTGVAAQDATGLTPRMLESEEGEGGVYQALCDSIGSEQTRQGEFQHRRDDGSVCWESVLVSPLRDESGRISHYVALKQDISQRKKDEERLRLAATVFEKSREGLLVTSADNRIKLVNSAFCAITGYRADEVIGKMPSLLSSGRHSAEFYQQMWDTLAGEDHWEGEIWNRRKSGEVYAEWLSVTAIRDDDGHLEEYVAVFSDITQRLAAEEHIRFQANYDALTRLPNRSLLIDRLGTAMAEANRRKKCFAVLFADLDRFKPVNDSLGHQAGDELLRQVAARLSALVRGNDTVARLSGDEFVLILNGLADRDGAAGMAERINRALAQPFDLNGHQVFIGSSVGISVFPGDGDDTATLLRNADMAMYRAKEAGRGTYRFFTEEMDAYITERLELDSDMRLGIEDGQFLLHFQPIVDPRDRRMLGAEALVRWAHPQRGLLGPECFIGLAEETGTIVPLGAWVLRAVCEQGAAWQRAGLLDFSLAVNVSSRQIRGGLSPEDIGAMLRETGFPAARLTLEITESLLLEETPDVIEWLSKVSAQGVRLALDDFGTGYSSLGYLRRFPIDALKIDRVFVSGEEQGQDLPLAEAILAMAHSLRLDVLAEGVEDERQLRFLRERGCHAVQGYLFSPPIPADELVRFHADAGGGAAIPVANSS